MKEPLAEALADSATVGELNSLADSLDLIAHSLSMLADGPTPRAAEILKLASKAVTLAASLRALSQHGEAPERVG